jgi:hypothetical protein
MGLAHVAVERFEVELEFAEVLGLEGCNLQFEGDEGLEPAMVEEEVEAEIFATDLEQIFFADETKVAAELDEEAAEVGDESALEVGLGVGLGQLKKIEKIGVFEERAGGRV